jgi:hypothetical protein
MFCHWRYTSSMSRSVSSFFFLLLIMEKRISTKIHPENAAFICMLLLIGWWFFT